jgi:hypothetical protein
MAQRLRLQGSQRRIAQFLTRVLNGDAPPGYQTPSLAYGPDFVLEIPGVERKDE